jgi:hypothetical protein
MKISIISNAGLSQATQLLSGVYGHLETDESGNAHFKIAPEFKAVSSIFESIDQGTVPVSINDVRTFEVPDELSTTVKANMMQSLGGRWDRMYSSMGSSANSNSMVAAMLAAERTRALGGACTAITSMGMRPYKLTFEIEAESAYRSTDIGSMNDLLKSMKPVDGARPVFTSAEVQHNLHEVVADAPAPVATHNEGEDMGIDQPRPWAFEGKKAAGTVTSTITVMAMNENAARSIASMIMGVSENALEETNTAAETIDQTTGEVVNATENGISRSVNSIRDTPIFGLLTITPVAVENLREGSEITYNEYDEEDEDEDEYQYRQRD